MDYNLIKNYCMRWSPFSIIYFIQKKTNKTKGDDLKFE